MDVRLVLGVGVGGLVLSLLRGTSVLRLVGHFEECRGVFEKVCETCFVLWLNQLVL